MSLVSRFSGTKFKQMVVFQTICIVAGGVYGLKTFPVYIKNIPVTPFTSRWYAALNKTHIHYI